MEDTNPTPDQYPTSTTYPCSGRGGYVSKGKLNFTGAPTSGQSQQQSSTVTQLHVYQPSTATQLHVCQQRSKLGQNTPKKNQECQKNRKKNHKRHGESLAPHVDVQVNVHNVKTKNSTRSTTFQGLKLEQYQRQVDGLLQEDKKETLHQKKKKKHKDETKHPQEVEEVEHLQLQRDLKIEKFHKDLLSLQVDLVTENYEVQKWTVNENEDVCSNQLVEQKEDKKEVQHQKKKQKHEDGKKTSTGSGGGGASATPEGPPEREIPQGSVIPAGGPGNREEGTPEGGSEQEGGGLQQTRCGKEGSPEGGGGTEQEDSNERGAATGGKLQ